MFVDTDDSTIAADLDVFAHVVLRLMNNSVNNVFLVTILHLVGVFYQYRYVKEQLVVILATLFDYYTQNDTNSAARVEAFSNKLS